MGFISRTLPFERYRGIPDGFLLRVCSMYLRRTKDASAGDFPSIGRRKGPRSYEDVAPMCKRRVWGFIWILWARTDGT